MYELASLVSLIKLQEASPSKDEALAATERMLRISEANYIKEYRMIPPTVEAIADLERRKEVMAELKEVKKEIVPQQHEAAPELTRRKSDPGAPTQEPIALRERSKSTVSFEEAPTLPKVTKRLREALDASKNLYVSAHVEPSPSQKKGRGVMSQ